MDIYSPGLFSGGEHFALISHVVSSNNNEAMQQEHPVSRYLGNQSMTSSPSSSGGYNVTNDVTSNTNDTQYSLYPRLNAMVNYMDLCFVPIIIVVGLVGNTLSFIVFVCSHLRKLSSSVYLAGLAVADTGFLLCLLVSWANNIKIHIYHHHGWCQMFVYMTYVWSFLSVWYIVSFSVERYIAVCHPFSRHQMCTVNRARTVLVILAVLSVVLYNFALWTSKVQLLPETGSYVCSPLEGYTGLVTSFNSVDTVLTLIIPYVTIFILNIRIIHAVVHIHQERRQLSVQGAPAGDCQHLHHHHHHRLPHLDGAVGLNAVDLGGGGGGGACNGGSGEGGAAAVVVTDTGDGYHEHHLATDVDVDEDRDVETTRTPRHVISSLRRSLSNATSFRIPVLRSTTSAVPPHPSQVKVTKTLVLVSTIFLLLNLPSHAIRFYGYVLSRITGQSEHGELYNLIQKLFQYIYFINFAINFFLYQTCGRNFRRALLTVFKNNKFKNRLKNVWRGRRKATAELREPRKATIKLCQFKGRKKCTSSSGQRTPSSNCHPPPLNPHFNDFLGKAAQTARIKGTREEQDRNIIESSS